MNIAKPIKLCMILAALMLALVFVGVNAEESIILDHADTSFVQKGMWTKDGSIGYNLTEAFGANAGANVSASWKISSRTPVGTTFRLYFWKTLREDASGDVSVAYSSETQELTKKLTLNRGLSGWEEIGIVSLSGAGATIDVTAESGKFYVSALKAVALEADHLVE